jgi:hypothetical protein
MPWDNYEPPDLAKFVVEAPLYESITLRLTEFAGVHSNDLPKNMPTFGTLLFGTYSVDAYCPVCGDKSIFGRSAPASSTSGEYSKQLIANQPFYIFVIYRCSRDYRHEFVMALRVSTPDFPSGVPHEARWVFVQKIGMLPSLADLQKDLDSRSVKALGKKGAAEFKRAVGLAAHGIGIGAFVYLRRIFEDLVDEVAQPALTNGEINPDEYAKSRMDEKVAFLKNYLPPFMFEHKQWYGVVSKGLHELTEQECIDYFPIVREGIEIMVAQKADRLEREEKEKNAGASIQALSAKLKAGDPKKPWRAQRHASDRRLQGTLGRDRHDVLVADKCYFLLKGISDTAGPINKKQLRRSVLVDVSPLLSSVLV